MKLINLGAGAEDLVAFDFSGSVLKMISARSAGSDVALRDYTEKKIDTTSDADLMKEVLEYFKSLHLRPKQIVCCIPSKNFITKNVEIPSTEKEEIAKIIDLQAGRFTPYSRDEIVIDFFCMDTPNQHYTSVLLIIVNRLLVDRYCRIFEGLGLPIKMMITSEALGLTYADKTGGAETLGGICFGADSSDFTVVDRGQIVFIRNFPIGAEQLKANAAEAGAELIGELNKSLAAYQDQGSSKPLKLLLLTGDVPGGQTLIDELKAGCPALQKFGASIQAQDHNWLIKTNADFLANQEKSGTPLALDMAVAVSQSRRVQIDLTPKEVRLRRRFREQSREITSLGITIMTIIVVLCLFLFTKIYFKNARLEKIEKLGKATFDEARLLERVSTKNRVVRKIIKMRGQALAAFGESTEFLGETNYLSNFTYDIDGKLTLNGTADSMSQVFALVNRLDSSNRYLNVKTTETKSRREGTKDVADFSIECILPESPAADKFEADKSGAKPEEAPKEKTSE